MKLEDRLREDGWHEGMNRLAEMKRQLELLPPDSAGYRRLARAVEQFEAALAGQRQALVDLVDSENDLDFNREIFVEMVLEISEKIKKHNPEAARRMFEELGIEATRRIFREQMDIDFDKWIEETE